MNRLCVGFQKRAIKQLADLPQNIQSRIEIKIDQLAANPYPPECKKLMGYDNLWRIRIGDYRVVYAINVPMGRIEICTVGHRQSVYKN